jgi:hypothetical protein
MPFIFPYLIKKPQELNEYNYTLNNPNKTIDPLGLMVCASCVTNCKIIYNEKVDKIYEWYLDFPDWPCDFSKSPNWCKATNILMLEIRLRKAKKYYEKCLIECDDVCLCDY